MNLPSFIRRYTFYPRFLRVLFLVLITVLLFSGIAMAQAGFPAIDRWVIGAGGGNTNKEGIASVDGTFGQPIIGKSSGGVVAISAGFWTTPVDDYDLFLPHIVR